MGDLEKGLQLVNQACSLDHLKHSSEALPLYKQSLELFNKAFTSQSSIDILIFKYVGTATDTATKKLLVEKMAMYSKRVEQIESEIKKSMQLTTNPNDDVEQLLANTIHAQKREALYDAHSIPSAPFFGNSNNEPDAEIRNLEERMQKLKAKPTNNNNITEQELNDRLAKLSGGFTINSFGSKPGLDLTNCEDLDEDEQIKRITQQALDENDLDMFTLPKDKESIEYAENDEPHGRPKKKISQPFEKPQDKAKSQARTTSNSNTTVQPKLQKGKPKPKKKKKKSDSDSDNSFSDSDSDVDDDPNLQPKEGDDDLKKREKDAIKLRFKQEQDKKRKAYEDWKKNKGNI